MHVVEGELKRLAGAGIDEREGMVLRADVLPDCRPHLLQGDILFRGMSASGEPHAARATMVVSSVPALRWSLTANTAS